MKFVIFGGFLMLSGAVIFSAATAINGTSELSYVVMGIGLVLSILGLIRKDKE